MKNSIIIRGAKQHNLKNINLSIPKNKLVVFTGVSGSGKSSMAIDTIYAEGQRRYVESLSSYARQFLGIMNKPDVESIEGLSPAIALDQKTTGHNPRSTVGTITEIYDYLRLLFAKIGHPHCHICGNEISKQSADQITDKIIKIIETYLQKKQQVRAFILSPIVRDRKGEFSSLLSNLKSQGFSRVRIDGVIYNLDEDLFLIKTNKHTIDIVLERITLSKIILKDKVSFSNTKSRIKQAVVQALDHSLGLVSLSIINDKGFSFPKKPKNMKDYLYSEKFSCPQDNISIPEIEPRTFSFNSPHGACETCNGLGSQLKIDPDLVINPDLSFNQGAILPFSRMTMKDSWFRRTVKTIFKLYNENLDEPWNHLSSNLKDLLLFGDTSRTFTVYGKNSYGKMASFKTSFEGTVNTLERRYLQTDSEIVRKEIEKYMLKEICPSCNGKRLKKEALSITINKQSIDDVVNMQINDVAKWVSEIKNFTSEKEKFISSSIVRELKSRLEFLVSVGLTYLTLSREASTLAGGEAQRIRLASQIGSGLTGVLYVLDEPTIGLHHRDNHRLIKTLKNLRDLGNTVLVVEHDRETIENADEIIDFGLKAGKYGGQIIAQGKLNDIIKSKKSITAKYLSNKRKINIKNKQLPENTQSEDNHLILNGCKQHNLKNIDVTFPLGKLICITGVSGSGKSTLIHNILYHALKRELNFAHRDKPGEFDKIIGSGEITKVSLIDQSPIGRTPRSNPVTYTKAFDYIRNLFTLTKESAIRGYKTGRFSFNVKGGRCEACQGCGEVKIEMQFLSDVYITCEVCKGSRYNSDTLEIKYKGKNINNILHMNVDEAYTFFKNIPMIERKLKTLQDVGLGYIELGQSAPTLSGGEAQRIKLSKELSSNNQGHTVYLLDEPTTGLHFADLEKLLTVLKKLVLKSNTVIIIEHNLDVIKNCDHIIDLGPEGGDKGGNIVGTGTPKQLSKNKNSYTGQALKKVLSI